MSTALVVRHLLALLTVVLVAACAAPDPADAPAPAPAPESSGPTRPAPATGGTAPPAAAPGRLRIAVAGTELTATLRDTAAARGLLAQLPLTLTMRDHGGVELTGPLSAPLPVSDEPEAADPAPADLGYYAPGGDLVLYHGDQSAYPGIVVLGELSGDLQPLAEATGDLRVTVRVAAP